MKKHILFLIFMVFGFVVAFAETKVSLTQSIRYGNGAFSTMDSPQISLDKALKEGGKVFLRYDFEVLKTDILLPFQSPNNIIICVKFPKCNYKNDNWNWESVFFGEKYLKVTSLFGADDLMNVVLYAFSGTDYYSELQKYIGRLPKSGDWRILNKAEYCEDSFCGIPLILENKKGCKAAVEFYIDINKLHNNYLSLDEKTKSKYKDFFLWETELFHEIPIDISFHNSKFLCDFAFGKSVADEYGHFEDTYIVYVMVEDFYSWQHSYSNSNRFFTLVVHE